MEADFLQAGGLVLFLVLGHNDVSKRRRGVPMFFQPPWNPASVKLLLIS